MRQSARDTTAWPDALSARAADIPESGVSSCGGFDGLVDQCLEFARRGQRIDDTPGAVGPQVRSFVDAAGHGDGARANGPRTVDVMRCIADHEDVSRLDRGLWKLLAHGGQGA